MNRLLVFLFVAVAAVLAVYTGLPKALNMLGLHPHYAMPEYNLQGHRALIITTSQGRLLPEDKDTGVFASEMTVPYYAFLDAGMDVDIASVGGGAVPIEPGSLGWPVATPADKRFRDDDVALAKIADALAMSEVRGEDYDIIFLAGGWGAAYDLGTSDEVGRVVTEAWADEAIVGGVCHGPLGLLNAVDESGAPLVAGRRLTAVTNKQIQELGITFTPQHPERELRAAGAFFEAETAFRDFFATHVVVDGRLVTGQNQNSGPETSDQMMRVLKASAERN